MLGTGEVPYGDVTIDLMKPFARLSMVEAVKKYSGVDFDQVETLEQARELCREHHIEFEERHKRGDILNLFFEEYVEDKLIQPTFITTIRWRFRRWPSAARITPVIRNGLNCS